MHLYSPIITDINNPQDEILPWGCRQDFFFRGGKTPGRMQTKVSSVGHVSSASVLICLVPAGGQQKLRVARGIRADYFGSPDEK